MKKLISIILTAVMLLTVAITASAASFKDVKSSDWYYSSVNYVADKGIMQGTSSTRFSPNQTLTRAMGVTLLYRVAGSPSVSGSLPFNDVKNGQWYTDAVKWAYSNGIVTGKSETFFHTNGNITRAEFATILSRFSSVMKYNLPFMRVAGFTDSAKIPDWANGAVNSMYAAEIINGRSDGCFDPNAKISRAEAAAMIERFMKAPKSSGSGSGSNNKPIENPEVPTTGQLVIKEKKYPYGSSDVMILNVENQTTTDITVTFTGKFMDSNGNVIKTQTKIVRGFPANYRNYVIFEPGVKFDKFAVETKITKYDAEAFMKYVVMDSEVSYTARKMTSSDLLGLHEKYPAGQERLGFYISFSFDNTSDVKRNEKVDLSVPCDMAFIGSDGVLYSIIHYTGVFHTSDTSSYKNQCPVANHILYKDWKQPANFKLTLVTGFTTVTPYGG